MPKKPSNIGTEPGKVKLSVRQQVLHEAGYKCANPRCRYPLTLDVHHLIYVSDGGSDKPENLVPLCPTCHAEHHQHRILTESLRAWKMLLLALNEAFDRRSIDLLLAIHKLGSISRISGDGVIDYSGLIASDLVSVEEGFRQTIMGMGANTQTQMYIARLTDKGKLFLEGWKNGDQQAAIALIPADAVRQNE